MFLAVDQGNTFLKATFIDGDDVCRVMRLHSADLDILLNELDCLGVDSAAFGAVGKIDVRLVESLRNAVSGEMLLLTHTTPLPITIDYLTPSTLGLDRIEAAVGATRFFPGDACIVADAGTALTLDMVDATGTFRGGNISPGLHLRLSSLHQAASALPLVPAEGELPPIGHDTESALRCGALSGICHEIAGVWKQTKALYGAHRLILTGGDAGIIYETMCQNRYFDIDTDYISLLPNLVAFGLQSIFDFNEKNL